MKENQEQSKRRLSTSDDEQILVFKIRDSRISSTTTINDDYDYSSDDTKNIIDDSAVPDEILLDLQIYNGKQFCCYFSIFYK